MVPHGVVEDLAAATRLAMEAGVDMDMESSGYAGHLAELVKAGEVSEELVDDAVRRVLRVKFQLDPGDTSSVEIGAVQYVTTLAPGDTARVQIAWDTEGYPGQHSIGVDVDPSIFG